MDDPRSHRLLATLPARRQLRVGGAPGSGRIGAATVAARVVTRLIELGVAAGVERAGLTAPAGISEEDPADPDARLPLATEIALWQALARRVSDPEFGVRAGAASRIRHLGLLGYVACFSATWGDALRRMQRYSSLCTEAVEFEFDEDRKELSIVRCHPALGRGRPLAQGFRLATVVQAGRELTGVEIVPTEVRFTYERPGIISAHGQHFHCPLHFAANRAAIVFRASDLSLPVAKADASLAEYLTQHAENVLASVLPCGTTRYAVRAAIWSLLADGKPALTQVAALLGMPPRTLQRRLATEGTSLHAEIEEIRRTTAIAALRNRSVSVEEIAFLLGYAEPSTFYRSFKRWTGATPQRFRRAPA